MKEKTLFCVVFVGASLLFSSQFVFASSDSNCFDGSISQANVSQERIMVADDDTAQMLLDITKKAADTARCQSNCNNRQTSCMMRCRSYKNNDPQGSACVMDCSNDYQQCSQNCSP